MRNWFLEKINKIDKSIGKLTKSEGEDPVNKVRVENYSRHQENLENHKGMYYLLRLW